MHTWRGDTGEGSKSARENLQLEGVTDEELTCLFDETAAGSTHPAGSPAPANIPPATSDAAPALTLTLGDTSAVVRVHPDTAIEREMPLFHGSWRDEESEPAVHRIPADPIVHRRGDSGRSVTTLHQPAVQTFHAEPTRHIEEQEEYESEAPFSWRRMFRSALISGGIGTAALLALHLFG